MNRQTVNNLFIHSSTPRLYQPLLLGVASYEALGNRIIQRIKAAQAFRRIKQVSELAAILIKIPIREYQLIAQYYLTWCNCRNADFQLEELERIAEQVQTYKSQALASRAAFEGEPKVALYFYTEALRTSRSVCEYTAATFGIAAIKGREGFHKSALSDMERVTRIVRHADPVVFFNFYNSYATELSAVGRLTEARNISRIVLASPFAFAYPEWQQTAEDLRGANRSFAFIDPLPVVPRNVLVMPVAEQESSTQSSQPARVFYMENWKKKMGKKKNGDKENTPAPEEITERYMFFRIMEIFSSDDTTDEQRYRLWEAAEKIAAEPVKPDNPDTPDDDKGEVGSLPLADDTDKG